MNFRCSIIVSSELRAGAAGQRVYHLPFQFHYEKTRIDEGAGERWFCSETEAPHLGDAHWTEDRVGDIAGQLGQFFVATRGLLRGGAFGAQRLIEARMHVADYLDPGQGLSLSAIACLRLHVGDVSRALQLAFLAPELVEAILDGAQPVALTPERLKRARELPLLWDEPRAMLSFDELEGRDLFGRKEPVATTGEASWLRGCAPSTALCSFWIAVRRRRSGAGYEARWGELAWHSQCR